MAQRWIVDASNVFGARPDGWWRDRSGALARLRNEVAAWAEATGAAATLVADGEPDGTVPEGGYGVIEVRFAHSRRRDAADDVIVDLVAADPEPSIVLVATSDRDLRARVESLGASTMGAGRFLDQLGSIDPPARPGADDGAAAVLDALGLDGSSLLGAGGEAQVHALDDRRVVRIPHRDVADELLDARRSLVDAIAEGAPDDLTFVLPEVLEHRRAADRTIVIERRLPGIDGMAALAAPGADRAAIVTSLLDAAARLADLRVPAAGFGEVWGPARIHADTFHDWAVARLTDSIAASVGAPGGLDPVALTDDLLAALPPAVAASPVLVHLDVFLGNALVADDRISAILDFGPMSIVGIAHLDPLTAIAYLAPEITAGVTDEDRAVGERWAAEHGLLGAVAPAEAWIAAYWLGAPDDERLQEWCRRILARR